MAGRLLFQHFSKIPRWAAAAVPLGLGSSLAHAVAGGAGGGGGGGFSGGGSDDGIGLILDLIFLILQILIEVPYPYNLLILGGLAATVLVFFFRTAQASSQLNSIPSASRAAKKRIPFPPARIKGNPGFDPQLLLTKARVAFPAIQQAWSRQDLGPVRRWISDGIWQRFNTQFAMMRLLGQRNLVSDIDIKQVFVDAEERDGAFDVAHVGIHFSAMDDFVCERFPELDQRGPVEMLEYWTFIRRRGAPDKDLYGSNRCPSCGAELPRDMGEVARCPSCQTVSSLGDYDWILSEITQADDYRNRNAKLAKGGDLTQRIRAALAPEEDFSVQHIEDRASNAYMQIMAARVSRRPEAMRRFVGDELFGRLQAEIARLSPFVFNRLYLNNVTLIDFFHRDGRDNLVVAFKYSAQRVDAAGDGRRLIDRGLYARDEIMILSRDASAGLPKGSLYAHACPACGGPVADTLDLRCAYCGEVLNSTRHDWIVTALLTPEEYKFLAQAETAMTTKTAVEDLDPMFDNRDYAFNNILMILGSDGAISPEEMNYAQTLARRLHYNPKKLAGLFELARNRRLALRLPPDRDGARKVAALMEQAAGADQRISPEEKALLEEVRSRVGEMAEAV